jgi:hypothetical protein
MSNIRAVSVTWTVNENKHIETRMTDQKLELLESTFKSFYSRDFPLTNVKVFDA